MRLFEFVDTALDVQVAIIADEIKTAMDKNELSDVIATDDLIQRFQDGGVPVDRKQLANMIQVPPLNTVIANMNDDEVTFKGRSDNDLDIADTSKQEKVVSNMAKKAMKK